MTQEVYSSVEYPLVPCGGYKQEINRTLSEKRTGKPASSSSPCSRLLYEAAVSTIELEVDLVAYRESTAKAER